MKVLAVLLLSGLAAGGGVGQDDWKMFMKWSAMKAQEKCFGEENTKIHTVNLKTAVAKCYQIDAPELNLPPYNAPYRFINTLMNSAEEIEQTRMMTLFQMMQMINKQDSYDHMSTSFKNSMHSKQYESKPWFEKMMEKMAMRKMFEKTMMNNYDSHDFSMYSNMNNNQHKNMFDFDNYDKHGSQSSYNVEKMMDAYGSKMNEDKMMENMMMYKMQQMQRSNDESSYNPFNKNTYRERMAALLQRHKRQVSRSNDPNSAVILPESLDVGDRLADKLKDQQHKMEEEIGNMTCVMREMGVLNEKNELDFNSQKRALDQFNLPNKWFKNRLLNDMEVCNKMAESLPYDYTQQHNFPGLVNLSQVKAYMKCCKYSKMRTCMYKDVKETLEKNFGSLDKIMEQTQLNEDQLFPLVTQLLHGEEMDYFGF